MKFAPGQVVNLKSGGQPLTVVAADEDTVECLWLGEEGDLFRESIPAIALELAFGEEDTNLAADEDPEFAGVQAHANGDDDDEAEDDEDEEEEDDEDEDEEDDDEDEDDEDEDEEEADEEEDRATQQEPAPGVRRRRRVPA